MLGIGLGGRCHLDAVRGQQPALGRVVDPHLVGDARDRAADDRVGIGGVHRTADVGWGVGFVATPAGIAVRATERRGRLFGEREGRDP